jgi:mono/diheme cytochrome c family protein
MKPLHVAWTFLLSAVVVTALAERPLARAQSGASGKGAYDRVCSECHGAEGKGKGGADDAPAIVPITKDYKSLLALVREGGCKMPTIPASEVSDEEVGQILTYLKSIGGASGASARLKAGGC